MANKVLRQYQITVRQQMDDPVIMAVNRKLPQWLNRLFGLHHKGFVTQDRDNRVWHVSFDGNCLCEETGEIR